MAKTSSFWASSRAVTALCELTGQSPAQCADLIGAVVSRKPMIRWIVPIAPSVLLLGWMFLFGRSTDLLEGTRWDIIASVKEYGALGVVVLILLGYGVAIALAVVAGTLVPRALLRRSVLHHLYSPACFWCGYSLRGLPRHGADVLCPECGRHSPVRLKDQVPPSARAI